MQFFLKKLLFPFALSAAAATFIATPVAYADETDLDADETASTVEAPSAATQDTLKKILSNTDTPLSIKMKDMNNKWRRFTANAPGSSSEIEVWGAAMGLEFGVHFTKGQTVTLGEDTFLVAYRLPLNIDRRFINWHGHGDPPRPRKPDSETVLSLSLLNLSSMNGLKDVRPFNPEVDMESVAQMNAASVKTLKTLGNGMMRFIRARGKFPTLSNPIDWDAKRSFYPYVGDERLYMHPSTQQMYSWNQYLNGKKAANFKNKQSVPLFYEAENSGDGTRGVLFMDGHVERLQPAHWERIKKGSKITEAAVDRAAF